MNADTSPLNANQLPDNRAFLQLDAASSSTEFEQQANSISATRRGDEDIPGGTDPCMTLSAHVCPDVPCTGSASGSIVVDGDGLHTVLQATQTCYSANMATKKKPKRRNRKAGTPSIGDDTSPQAADSTINGEEFDKVIGLIKVASDLRKSPLDMLKGFTLHMERNGADARQFRMACAKLGFSL